MSLARGEDSTPPMPSFELLHTFIAQAIARISEHDANPVIVVNSDAEIQQQQQTLDFDRHDIWRILVGGAKLSRGFTVEGLTVTYFRRATNMSDSLTQMGRWFGFRHGYRDLVRLYIARRTKFGSREVDLYDAFRGIAEDESAFRRQLEQYAGWDGDKPRVVPSQIPPLVSQHLPWLRPTARNKMFNAQLVEQSDQPFSPAGYSDHLDELKANLETWRPILANATQPIDLPQRGSTYAAYIGLVNAEIVLAAIEDTNYLYLYGAKSVKPKAQFYRRMIEEQELRDFLVIVPQPDTPTRPIGGVGARAIVSRDRREGRFGKFGEITEPKHKPAVERFVARDASTPASLRQFLAKERGALLLYIAQETRPSIERHRLRESTQTIPREAW